MLFDGFQLTLFAFFAGILTVLAPCILPLLPVILGASFTSESRIRPYIVVASLFVSLLIFTLLIKVSLLFVEVDPQFWITISALILGVMGVFSLFPALWEKIATTLHLSSASHSFLSRASHSSGVVGAILLGASLGPVFSSCSPTYALILATVLPVDIISGIWYMTVYGAGLSLCLLGIIIFGRKFSSRLKFLTLPGGWLQRLFGVILIVVACLIFTGYDKKLSVGFANLGLPDVTKIESYFLDKSQNPSPRSVPLEAQLEAQQTGSVADEKVDLSIDTPYEAPELVGIQDWINSNPLTLEALKGKVVLIDFWTYSCINCVRTLPYLTEWDAKYRDKGLVIIGVHAPEFAFEKVKKNVEKSVQESGISYPVALDNAFSTWNAYKNLYWPAKYFIDREGSVRHTHFGEGEYTESEKVIQYLLSEGSEKQKTDSFTGTTSPVTESLSMTLPPANPETYFGADRHENYVGQPNLAIGTTRYDARQNLSTHEWTLSGSWKVTGESIESLKGVNSLAINVSASKVHIVLTGPVGSRVQVSHSGGTLTDRGDVIDGWITIDSDRLYTVFDPGRRVDNYPITLTFPSGVQAYAATFTR